MREVRLLAFVLVLGVAIASWVATCSAWQFDRVAAGVVPLDPRGFGALTLVTIGTGGARENPNRRGPALAVGAGRRVVLVDAGRGVAGGLRAARIPVTQPDTVFLTSLLPENTVGLDDLWSTRALAGGDAPLRLVGPPGTAALAASLEAAHGGALAARADALGRAPPPRLEVEEVGDGFSEDREGLRVRAAALPGGPVLALAYRFERDERSLVVGSVGWGGEALVALADRANALVYEAVFVPDVELAAEMGLTEDPEELRREAEFHTTLAEIGQLATSAWVDALVLVRLSPPPVYDVQVTSQVEGFQGRILIPDDGDELRP